MPLYNVYQNKAIAKHGHKVNELGWDEASKQFPDIKAHLDCTTMGSKKWSPAYKPFYSHVLEVEADGLEDVFALCNGVPKDNARIVREIQKWHSLSVGDIVELDKVYYMVDGVGFNQIDMP